mmetsp:Transcript_35851/g.32249  ORF Transcript_35851/g.32249 Transcript_35851/m.32249 type:complete len:83 (+) Transcript_35851:16-264(+)
MITYKNIAISMVKAENNGEFPQFEKKLPVEKKFSNDVETFIFTMYLEQLLHKIEEDDSTDVVKHCLELLEETVHYLGPAAIY